MLTRKSSLAVIFRTFMRRYEAATTTWMSDGIGEFQTEIVIFISARRSGASRTVLVIVSGSSRRKDGRKGFWSQLNNSKLVR